MDAMIKTPTMGELRSVAGRLPRSVDIYAKKPPTSGRPKSLMWVVIFIGIEATWGGLSARPDATRDYRETRVWDKTGSPSIS